MKIAYLFSRYPVPSQTFCDTEIRALEAAGHEIEIYSCSPPTSSFRHGGPADWPRARVFYAPPASVLDAWEDAARRDGSWPKAMIREHELRFGLRYDPARRARHAIYFADLLRRRGIEHVHVHFANRATHAALFIRRLTSVPFSFTAHAQDFLVDLGSDELLRLMCESAAFVVAVSEWSRRALVERCPAAEAKIHRVYNGLDLDRWPLPIAPPSKADTWLKIFSVGRLIQFKGFQDLISACALLRERGTRFRLEIAGEGPWRERLEEQVADFATPYSEVRFSGLLPQREVRRQMEACDVFALASRVDDKGACDVLPTVILEAMACAKPVVSTDLAGIPELVLSGQTGRLVPPASPEMLADALASFTTAETAQAMGQAGRARVAGKFSSAESARQIATLFAVGKGSRSHHIQPTVNSAIACLCDSPALGFWPSADDASLIYLTPEDGGPPMETLGASEYLPDDLVLETYWRQHDPLIHQMEGWRAEAGGACSTQAFLLACRRAWYLRSARWPGAACAPRHLHAIGPQALLCTWLLRRLGKVSSASFLLPAPGGREIGLAGSTVRKLAPNFVGGWIAGERKLAAALGPSFQAVSPEKDQWRSTLADWSAT